MQKKIAGLLLWITTGVFAQNAGSFSGQVIDAETQQPLEGATIVIEGTSEGVISDAQGYFVFQDIPAQTYNLTASYLGHFI